MTEERGQIVGRGEFFHYFRSTDCLQFFPLLCTWHCTYICTWHWTSFIFFAFSPFVTLLSALHSFLFLSNSLHFALCCSLLCTLHCAVHFFALIDPFTLTPLSSRRCCCPPFFDASTNLSNFPRFLFFKEFIKK